MPDVRLAGDRRLDPDGARRQAQRQVVGQALDPRQLDARLHVQRVLRDDRPLLDASHLHPDPEVGQRLLDPLALGGEVQLGGAAGRGVGRAGRAPAAPRRVRWTRGRRRPRRSPPPRPGAAPPRTPAPRTLDRRHAGRHRGPDRRAAMASVTGAIGHGRLHPRPAAIGRRAGPVGALPPHDQRRRVLVLSTAEGGADPLHQAHLGGRLERCHRNRLRPRAARGLTRLGGGQLLAILTALQPGGHHVADRHVEVEQHADHEQQDQHDPGAHLADGVDQHPRHAVADHSPALALLDRLRAAAHRQVEHAEQRERHHGRAAGRHPALGWHRLHPQHEREARQQRRREGDPPAQQLAERVAPRPHHGARLGREQGDHADDGQDHQPQRQQLADGASAHADARSCAGGGGSRCGAGCSVASPPRLRPPSRSAGSSAAAWCARRRSGPGCRGSWPSRKPDSAA